MIDLEIDLDREYELNLLLLQQDIAMWQDDYLERQTAGKTDAQLLHDGWHRCFRGSWYSKKMDAARNRKFGKRLEELGRARLMLLQKSPDLTAFAMSKESRANIFSF